MTGPVLYPGHTLPKFANFKFTLPVGAKTTVLFQTTYVSLIGELTVLYNLKTIPNHNLIHGLLL